MGLFGNKRPILKREEIADPKKVSKFLEWFIKNEDLVNTLGEPSNNTIFNEGFRPFCGEDNNPENASNYIPDLRVWFTIKMMYTLNYLKESTKEEWSNYLDALDQLGQDTLATAGELSIKYNLNMQNFKYNSEIKKINDNNDLSFFKDSYLKDNVIGAELRILAWLFLNYFGEPYKIV